MPDFIPPMSATLATHPFSDPDWLFEVKWDGYRVEAVVRDGKARLWTRRRQDASAYFPDLAEASGWIDAREAIVDGEVVALDEQGRPRFSLLQDHTGIRTWRTPGGKRRDTPAEVVYQAFDLLHLDGQSLLSVPLEERKRLLRSRLRPHPLVRFAGHVEADGDAFFAAARAQELEGVVAKLKRSPYEPDRRSRSWLKLKVRREQEIVVVGWLPGQGSHADLGSLILGVRSGDRWVHAGQVGSGLDARTRRELLARLREIERPDSPLDPAPRLRGARWVEPRIVIRVEFAEWTADDLLRQAAFKGFEPDRDPRSVRREREVPTARATAEAERAHTPDPMPSAKAAADPTETIAAPRGDREGGDLGRRRPRDPGHEPREGPLHRPRRRAAGHEARPAALPRRGRPDARAVPRPPRADGPALPERQRAEGLLAEGPARPCAGLDQALDVPPSRGGAEGVRGRRLGRHAGLAGAGGRGRAAPVDEPDRGARTARRTPSSTSIRGRTRPGRSSSSWLACTGPRSSISASSAIRR